ncbi:MAG: hypothetical protein H6839_05940 [Planctomycetes bacterium]|nr:hypothetical protein [Planctomycetota bacterium]
MIDPFSLPADEQETLRNRVRELFAQWGGEDVDRAIARDRKVLAEHERELDHVATLPFEKPYRWRIAPSVGLRAQKDLERQQKRRAELLHMCMQDAMRELGHIKPAPEVTHGAPIAGTQGAVGDQVEQLSALLARAVEAVQKYEEQQERAEASPPVETAAA